MTNTDRIAEIRARAEAATPGPGGLEVKGNTVKSFGIPGVCSGMKYDGANASFIAHARTDIPYLLDRLAEKTEEADHYRVLRLDADRIRENLMDKEMRLISENMKLEKRLAEAEADRDALDKALLRYEEESFYGAIKQEAELPKWTPVSVRYPKPYSFILAADCFGVVRECYYEKVFTTRFGTTINVTHWMPLPEPPEKGAGK